MISIQTNAAEFNRTLAEYVALRKRDLHTEVVRKARDISLRLAGYNDATGKYGGQGSGIKARSGGFGPPVQSTPERVQRDAESRNWAIGRDRKNTFTKRGDYGVSEAAAKLAKVMMEGQKSQAFRMAENGAMYPARFAKSKRNPKLLVAGKRWHIRGRSLASLGENELDAASQSEGASGLKLLNVSAVARYVEVRLRKRAAIGGLLSVQWLPNAWRKRAWQKGLVAPPKSATYTAKSKDGKIMGRVDVANEVVSLTASVPGTRKFPQAIAGALRAGAEDMREYIRTKMLAQAKRTILKQFAPDPA